MGESAEEGRVMVMPGGGGAITRHRGMGSVHMGPISPPAT